MDHKYKYTSTFTTIAKVVTPTDEDRFVAKASIEPLRALLPADVDVDASPDLLYVSANGAVAGMVNLNGDAISVGTALAINHTAKNKYLSTDHDRDKVVGVILYPGFSRLGTNEPISAEEAVALKEPFNMSFAGAIWKTISPMLAKYLTKVGDALDEDALSISWEVAFNEFDIGVGSKNLFDAKMIAADSPDFASYASLLRSNGGEGKDKAGNAVFRVLNGDALILGYSVVPRPAAAVKGILPIESTPAAEAQQDLSESETEALVRTILERAKNEPAARAAVQSLLTVLAEPTQKEQTVAADVVTISPSVVEPLMEVAASVSPSVTAEKVEPQSVTSVESRVIPFTPIMKITKADISANWNEIRKLESSASVIELIDAIEQGSQAHISELDAAKSTAQAAEQARLKAEATTSALQQSIAELQTQLAEVKANAEASAAQAKYAERMASFDEVFDLGDEERKLIAKEVLAIDTDDSFAECLAKYGTLLAAKKKGKAPPFGKKDDKKADDKEDAKDGGDDEKEEGEAKAAADKTVAAEAFASVKEIPGQTQVPNSVLLDKDVAAQMAAAFGTTFKVNGKAAAQK